MPTNQQRREAAKRKLERQLERRAERSRRNRQYAVIASAVSVVLVIGLVILITVLSGDDDDTTPAAPIPSTAVEQPTNPPTETAPAPSRSEPLPGEVDCQYLPSGPPAKPVNPPPGGSTTTQGTVEVTLETSAGTIPLNLNRAQAPCTVASFLSLAQQGFYNDTPCHRMVTSPGLGVLQCGDPSGQGNGGPGYSVPDEVAPDVSYGRGYIAMANSGTPNSGGSQFFMIFGDADALNANPVYTVFGSVSEEGLTVLDEIAAKGHDGSMEPSPGGGVPNEPVTITSATQG